MTTEDPEQLPPGDPLEVFGELYDEAVGGCVTFDTLDKAKTILDSWDARRSDNPAETFSDDVTPRRRRPIDRRHRRLVIALLGTLYELDERTTIEERELVATFAGDEWTDKTVKRTIGELVDFGAVRRLLYVGGPRYGRRAPARLRLTDLGRAWTDRRLEPYVVDTDEDDPDSPE